MKRRIALLLLGVFACLMANAQKAYQLPNLNTLNSNSLFITTIDAAGGGSRHTSYGQLQAMLSTNPPAGTLTNDITGNAAGATNAPDGSPLGSFATFRNRHAGTNYEAPRVILDHDFMSDLGDAHGLKIAFALADQGLLNIVAMGNTLTNEYMTSAMAAFANYYGYGHVPLGVATTNQYSAPSQTITNVGKFPTYPGVSLYSSNYPSAVSVYRKVLKESPDGSVVFLAEGDLQNLRALWDSPADSISSLNGSNLCNLKFKYLLISGGQTNWTAGSIENNLSINPWAAGVVSNLTVPTVWMFGDITTNALAAASWINVGQNSYNTGVHPADSPVYVASSNYNAAHSTYIRPAWDGYSKSYLAAASQIANGTNWIDGRPLFTVVGPGRPDFVGGGKFYWSNSISGKIANHYYLVENGIASIATNFINALIDAPPIRGGANQITNAVLRTGSTMSGLLAVTPSGGAATVNIGPDTAGGISWYSSAWMDFISGGAYIVRIGGTTPAQRSFTFPNYSYLNWANGAIGVGSVDVGLRRNTTDELGVDNGDGTGGTWRDLRARTLTATNHIFPTNYLAGNFTPVPGYMKLVVSNNVLYAVTNIKTNVVSTFAP